MNKTDEKIKKCILQGCSNGRIIKKLGRKPSEELEDRINKLR